MAAFLYKYISMGRNTISYSVIASIIFILMSESIKYDSNQT